MKNTEMEMNSIEDSNDKNLNNNIEYKKQISIGESLRKHKHYEKILKLIKCIIFILCLIGLIFQTTLLFNEFYSGETVVKTTFSKPKLYELPAITVCFPILLSFKNLTDMNPKLKPTFDEYMNIFNNSDNANLDKHENKTLLKEWKNIYKKALNDLYLSSDLHIQEFIDKIIPYEIKSNNSEEYSVKVMVLPAGKLEYSHIYTNPIESIMWYSSIQTKCYTFLTEQNTYYNNDLINLINIRVDIKVDKTWGYFKNDKDTFYLSLHSPKYIPYKSTITEFNTLSMENIYQVKFNKIKTKLLKKPYLTNCADYNQNDGNSDISRSDCILNCLNTNMDEKCKLCDTDCSKCFVNFYSIFNRISMLKNIDKKYFCPINDCIRDEFHSFDYECQTKCLDDCEYEYIDYSVEKMDYGISVFNLKKSNIESAFLFISPKQLPDQLVEHMPTMSTISFISNFGGLLGMWLGLSALAVFETLIKYLDQ